MLEVIDDEEPANDGDPNTRAKLLKIGNSVIFPDYSVKVNIDKLKTQNVLILRFFVLKLS